MQRRRIDRILDEAYLEDIESRSTDDLRRMRDECEEEESGISYARRVIQGKLDIIRAEVLRRREAGDERGDVRSLLDALPGILGDARGEQQQPLRQRVSRFIVPPAVQYHRRDVDRIADEQALAALPEKSTDELGELAEGIAGKERELSTLRRTLLDRVDAIQEELARRYKEGQASVGEVLRREA